MQYIFYAGFAVAAVVMIIWGLSLASEYIIFVLAGVAGLVALGSAGYALFKVQCTPPALPA